MKWFIKCFKQYADFKGRARRREFWWFTLINFIIMVVFMIFMMVPVMKEMLNNPELLESMAGSSSFDTAAYSDEYTKMVYSIMMKSTAFYIYCIYSLAVLLPSLAVSVRRLHDTGRNGWWCLMPIGASLLQSVLQLTGMSAGVTIIVSLAVIAVSIVFIVWMFLDSQPGENQWGPNPKETKWETAAEA